MRLFFCCLFGSVLSSWLLCALCGKLSGRFLRSFHNYFREEPTLSSAVLLLLPPTLSVSSDPQGSKSTSDSGTTQAKTMDSKKHMMEKTMWRKGLKSPWRRITACRLQIFYYKLIISAKYSPARMFGWLSQAAMFSCLKSAADSPNFSTWNNVDCIVECDPVPRAWESSNTDEFHQTGNCFLLGLLVIWWKQNQDSA